LRHFPWAFNGESETPGYGIANLQVTWNAMESLRFELHAHNLFDRGYQDHLAGTNRVSGVDIPPGERLYGRGRTITAGVNLSF